MRRVTTLAVVLAVVAGLLAMFAFTALSDRAGAAGSRPEQAEVSLMAPGGGFSGPPSSYSNPGTAVAIDTTSFPTDATFTFSVAGIQEIADDVYCFRLAEVDPPSTVNPITASELCTAVSADGEYFALQSGPLTLSAGEHIYILQERVVSGILGDELTLGNARVVAEWTEPTAAVGGIALLPTISDSSAYNYIALVGVAAAVLFTLAAGVRHARRRFSGD